MMTEPQTTFLEMMDRLKGEAFVEEHMDAILQMFNYSWSEGFKEGYEECMCDSSWPDTDERIIA